MHFPPKLQLCRLIAAMSRISGPRHLHLIGSGRTIGLMYDGQALMRGKPAWYIGQFCISNEARRTIEERRLFPVLPDGLEQVLLMNMLRMHHLLLY
jgi:hypothetical protein